MFAKSLCSSSWIHHHIAPSSSYGRSRSRSIQSNSSRRRSSTKRKNMFHGPLGSCSSGRCSCCSSSAIQMITTAAVVAATPHAIMNHNHPRGQMQSSSSSCSMNKCCSQQQPPSNGGGLDHTHHRRLSATCSLPSSTMEMFNLKGKSFIALHSLALARSLFDF